MKLSTRLQQLDSMVTAKYTHIWDCCCDHGLLGQRLLERQAASQTVHFVDIVPQLIKTLKADFQLKFGNSDGLAPHWQTHCTDTALLSLDNYSGRQLVIIAGVGGDQTRDLVAALIKRNPAADLDFLLCPVYHQFSLRELLIELDFRLLSEYLVCDNKRYYELLLTSRTDDATKNQSRISKVGSDIWTCDNPQQTKVATHYLNKTISHYKKKQTAAGDKIDRIVKAYQSVFITSNN